ncbi:MAG: AraC family transcriptional regulator [Halanaerobium sp.]|nr:AraC family transcriptional regulator [Halanaerobium sp.]
MLGNEVLARMQLEPPKNIMKYESESLVIFKPSFVTKLKSVFTRNFHLIIPQGHQLPLRVDNRVYIPEINKLFCINPGQTIQGLDEAEVPEYLAIFIDRDYLSGLARVVLNETDFYFTNINYQIRPDVPRLIRKIIKEQETKQPGYQFYNKCLIKELIVNILRDTACPLTGRPTLEDNIGRVIEYIRTSFSRDISLEELAEIARLSPYHFIRVFKKITGRTPFVYLKEVKVERAKELLEKTDLKMIEISLRCGFSNPSHFSTLFKKATGCTPSDYRSLSQGGGLRN